MNLLDGITALDSFEAVIDVPDPPSPLVEHVLASGNLIAHTVPEMVKSALTTDSPSLDAIVTMLSLGDAGSELHEEIVRELRFRGWRSVRFSADPERTRWIPGDATPEVVSGWAEKLSDHLNQPPEEEPTNDDS